LTNLAILGSTGSIGRQALDVARTLGLRAAALACKSDIRLMEEQVREFRPALAAVADERAAAELKVRVADTATRVVSGEAGLLETAALAETEVVLNALVGVSGLAPTLAALQTGKTVALANKETMVAGGELVKRQLTSGGALLPVDSEHSAIFQCLASGKRDEVTRLILTASGGPFFGRTRAQLDAVTPEQALRHPNWRMGPKITVDCATLMNKGLEVIEAAHLFDVPESKIDVLVHRESVVHSMVEFRDGTLLAQLGAPDMRLPIQYALTYPERLPSPAVRLDLLAAGALTFRPLDEETFPAVALCRRAYRIGGCAPAALSAANEEAVALFLAGHIKFTEIVELSKAAMDAAPPSPCERYEQVLAADGAARGSVHRLAGL